MSKKIFIRREDLGGHLPKAVRAEAVLKLSSLYVNRQPLKGIDAEDEKKIFTIPEFIEKRYYFL